MAVHPADLAPSTSRSQLSPIMTVDAADASQLLENQIEDGDVRLGHPHLAGDDHRLEAVR